MSDNVKKAVLKNKITAIVPVHQQKLDDVTVSAVDVLTGDGPPGEAGARVRVTTP